MKKIPEHIRAFLPTIERNISESQDNARLKSWVYLGYHAEICTRFSKVLYDGASGNADGAKTNFYLLRDYLSDHELEFHDAFDVFLFLRAVSSKLGIKMPGFYE